MYTVSVPILSENLQRQGRERFSTILKEMGIKRVFLGLGTYTLNKDLHKKRMNTLKENCEYLKGQGFEVGAWTWALWINDKNDFRRMKSFQDVESNQYCCPLDDNFRNFVSNCIMDIAKCGVDIIMFDDDFRYQHLDNGLNCVCDLHLKKINEILGENIDASKLYKLAFNGGKNKYRDAWVEANRFGLELFAKDIRTAVDKVNPNIRVGACSCLSSWNSDGIKPYEIAKIFAGNTKPFFRSIGAPYWAIDKHWNNRLNDIFEVQRWEASLVPNGIEMFAEGDVFPRPRFKTPASFLELYDMLIRADGRQDGILKYMFDYVSNIDYERGYTESHIKHKPIYEFIEKNFAKLDASGVSVYTDIDRVKSMKMSNEEDITTIVNHLLFYPEGRFCAELSIPSTYRNEGICGIAFGESVLQVPSEKYNDGIITDIVGARFLQENGIDVGLSVLKNSVNAKYEYFNDYNEYVPAQYEIQVAELNKNARVLSEYRYDNGNELSTPATYCYTNCNGNKFFVICSKVFLNDETLIRSYARARQTKDVIEKYFNKQLPCSCVGNPDLYLLCKENKNEKVIGLWNTSYDEIDKPLIEFSGLYKKAEYINCSGEINNHTIELSTIPAYSFAGIKLLK